jgi:hypothetical protein
MYRSVPKHVGFISKLLLQAMKVPVHVLVCCFAIFIPYVCVLVIHDSWPVLLEGAEFL